MAGSAQVPGEIAALSEERSAIARRTVLLLGTIGAGLSVGALLAIGGYTTPIPPIAAGLYIAAGTIDGWRRPTNSGGWILLAAGWFIGIGPLTRVGIPSVAIPVVSFGNAPEVLATAALLTFPQGRFTNRVDMGVWLAALGVFLVDAIAILVLADPANSSTPWQPVRLPVEQVGSEVYTASIYPLTLVAGGVISVVVAWRAVERWRHASTPLRHVLQPVVLAAVAGVGVYFVSYLLALLADAVGGSLSTAAFTLARLSIVLLPAAFLVAVLRLRSDRAAVVDLVELLGQSPAPGVLSQRVRGVLHDPSAQLLSWSEERSGWLDESGREIDAGSLQGRTITRVEDQGRLVAGIAHDHSLEGADAILTPLRVALALALRPVSSTPPGPASPAHVPGGSIGPYEVERELGRGGMGIVYLARDTTLGRLVALKVLDPALATDPHLRHRFIREARTVAQLEHPNVVPVFGAGEADQLLWIASRWIDGQDLGALLRSSGRLSIDRTLDVVSAVAGALDFAAGRGFVHRDVKPSNILLAATGESFLADFGLTRALDDGGTSIATETGAFIGTVDFVAPEQIRGDQLSPAVDVYSLACVAYTCLVGEPPFRRPTPLAIMWAHLHDEPPLASDRSPDIPSTLAQVIVRGLAKEPGERPQSAGAFASAAREATHPGGA